MSAAPLRLALGGLASENCTFSPVPTRREDFRVLRGEGLRERYAFLEKPDLAGAGDLEFLPLLHARALPGGVIERGAYEELKGEFLRGLAGCGALQGVLLDLHGAMHVEGLQDAEADLAAAVRGVVGPGCLVGASMDLHGNVSAALAGAADLFSAYRTAPHEDEEETRERVCRMLAQCLRRGWRPCRAWVRIPVLLPGESTSTQAEPGRSLYAALPAESARAGVLDASLWVGYVWEDAPRAGASVVVTGLDREAVRETAAAVARRYWEARSLFAFGMPAGPVGECLDRALAFSGRPVMVSDSGDNPTAGGIGSLCQAAEAALQRRAAWSERGKTVVVAGLWAAEAVLCCARAGAGAEVTVEIGYRGEASYAESLQVRGRVERLVEGDPVAGLQAVLACGPVRLLLTERRKPFHHLEDFRALGVDVGETDVVVVKMGYLVPELYQAAAASFLALTPGPVDQAVERLPFRFRQRPTWPFERDFAWEPEEVRVFP